MSKETRMAEEVKLLKTWSSPFGLRIVWALKLKGIEYESIDEDLSNKSPLLLHSNPIYKKIPVLIHNGKPISESVVILEYIDQTWTQNPILPQHPFEKARQRFWAKFNDNKLIPSVWSVFVNEGKEKEEALLENLKLVEEELKGKRFFGGDKIGLVDLVFGWLANLMGVFEEVTGLKLIDDRFPLLSAWILEFSEIPIIKDNWPSHDKLVVKYRALHQKFHPLK
ncbi:Detected protein of confused Function [Hibiscus syriacus]|uniref:glutathione transferase n=1 Tax=Hibiscus syriacus TaxID=106335 RepID=A0A6A2YJ64_HIBSY|nr:probable glutathione S-transferase [Hibiscus syriacus]KAE8678939.1 Detected protein of confused Function [Hibiscus syriacus]